MSENTTHAAGENTNPAAVGYHHITDLKGHQMNMPMNSMRRTDMTTKAQATSGRGVLRAAVAQASEQLAARQAAWNLRARADQDQARDVRDNLIRHQGITILTQLSGPQYATATVMNIGRPQAVLTVVIGTIVMTFQTKKAATQYGEAWTDHAVWALQMPAWTPEQTRTNRYAEPGVIVTATEEDRITANPGQTLTIISGRVAWEVLDREAFSDVHSMWREVMNRATENLAHLKGQGRTRTAVRPSLFCPSYPQGLWHSQPHTGRRRKQGAPDRVWVTSNPDEERAHPSCTNSTAPTTCGPRPTPSTRSTPSSPITCTETGETAA